MQNWRLNLLFYLFIAMMAALFLSRIALSVSMIAFCVTAFMHKEWITHFTTFFRTRLLWGMSLLFLLPMISGIWSSDKAHWLEVVQIKLPLLFLPLAFAGPLNFSERQWKILACVFVGIVAAACGWSLFHYSNDTDAINKGYLQARSLVTALQNDHVRFSWLVNIAAVLSFWIYTKERKLQSGTAIIFFLFAIGFIIYIHILAARTGVLSFYSCLILVSAWLLIKMKARWLSVTVLAIVVVIPVIAYWVIPSFQNRIKYMRYDWSFATHANYQPSTTDAVRKISIIGGWEIMKSNALGVGFGDLPHEMNAWYAKHYPQMINEDKILPSSEWLVYGASTGIAGLLTFTFFMLVSLTVRLRNKLIWYMLQVTAALSFIADIGLEVQFGVFLYSFIVLWWWKWFTAQNV